MTIKGYPTPVRERHGCRVSWYTYADLKTARQASTQASKEAVAMKRRGFDFGFMTPGCITKTKDNMFEVVIP